MGTRGVEVCMEGKEWVSKGSRQEGLNILQVRGGLYTPEGRHSNSSVL